MKLAHGTAAVALAFLAASLTAALAGGCAGGDNAQTHGPLFDPDAGNEAAPTDGSPDVRTSDAPADSSHDTGSPPDASTDAPLEVDADAAGQPEAGDAGTCTSTVAVVGGNATTAFGATTTPLGAWTVSGLSGQMNSAPALATVNGGFEAVVEGANNGLLHSTFASSWSPLAQIGAALTAAAPALAPIGTTLHLVYLGTDDKFYHGTFAAGAWDGANDRVGVTTDGGFIQSFGPSGPTAAAAGSTLVMAQDGSDAFLYDQSWTGSWQAAQQQAGTSVVTTLAPTLVALSGGASDLLLVFIHQGDFKITWTARGASSGAWTAPAVVNTNAFTNDPVALAPLPGGRALLIYRGASPDTSPYYSVFDPTLATAWSTPASVVPQKPAVASTPSIAPGVCGDDVIAAYAGVSEVDVVHYQGGSWSAPSPISGSTGATFAAIATLP